MKLIVGLGNPGPQYAQTRHNVGFQVVELFARTHSFTTRKMQFNAILITGRLDGEKIALARPLTFMNESGRAVGPLLRWHKLGLSELLVIYDDLDLPTGRIRLRPDGGSGGHHGMESIIRHLGSDRFPRLRIGVGRPVDRDGVNYVLSEFLRDELPLITAAQEKAAAAIEVFITKGLTAAMNQFNA